MDKSVGSPIPRSTVIAALMWLEYATEGDESARRATGLDVNGCVWVAHQLLSGDPHGWIEHARHMAAVAIEEAKYVERGGE